ncbi:carotenoid ester lipase precursor [Phanerochaete sordida]|uniref:Carotenoid ester lipase n=1 Tax=Phanerochaete sordida TaxID=48140 RepID=A0A9P3GD78_9APHY|nr:carotenoid ester lipase precursor [Phanerochaete sordida]
MLPSLVLLSLALGRAMPSSAAPAAAPSVTLDHGTFVGSVDGLANRFLGIPFAKPPVGDLRFRLPVPNAAYSGTHTATAFGHACPQQTAPPQFPASVQSDVTAFVDSTTITDIAEDCLTLNVWTPANVAKGAKLPVVVWIYGGGFETGGTSTFNGSAIVSRSVEMNTPVVYVSMNYRLTVFGFLASQEVKNAGVGNLGMQDQRQAMRWVQQYISAFNGDPTKVTIFGESAGSISVSLHLLTSNGNPGGLFRAAFMESGSPFAMNDITHGQQTYDGIVEQVGCAGAKDTLECLRQASFQALMDVVNASPGLTSPLALNLPWAPLVDGVFLTDDPQKLVARGAIANIPFVNGDCDDEGTLFSIGTLNLTTDAEVRAYLSANYFPNATPSQLDTLLEIYPQDPAQGSPFGTGDANAISPQFKRLAAIQGDLVFQGPRRFLLNSRSSKQATFSYLNKRLKATPGLGSAHGTDLLNMYGPGDMTEYLINFASTLNPNGPGLLNWPAYTISGKQLLTFLDGAVPLAITQDNFRTNGTDLLTQLLQANPLGGGTSE